MAPKSVKHGVFRIHNSKYSGLPNSVDVSEKKLRCFMLYPDFIYYLSHLVWCFESGHSLTEYLIGWKEAQRQNIIRLNTKYLVHLVSDR